MIKLKNNKNQRELELKKFRPLNNLDIDEDYVFKADDKPVNINSFVKVNFNNHVIDVNNTGGVFNIIADNVELSNFIVINSNGKIIDSKANNTVLKDISFIKKKFN